MSLSDRDYIRGEHPPTCTCVDCSQQRTAMIDRKINSKYYKNKYQKINKTNTKLIAIKTFLILLVFACISFVGLTAYLLYKVQINTITGIILLIITIGVLIWNISSIKKYRVHTWTLISLFLVVALIGSSVTAFAGVEPLSNVKNQIEYYIGSFNIGSSDIQARIIPEGESGSFYNVRVELTPSDSIKIYDIYSVQLISESYSFGRSFVCWTPDDSRTIKMVSFRIINSDKVATKLKNLDEESLGKLFLGYDVDEITDWYDSNINKLLNVKITGNIKLSTEAIIHTEAVSTDVYSVSAIITPSSSVVAGETYNVALMQQVENQAYIPDGIYIYRSESITWRRSEIDSNQTKTVIFGNFSKDYWESNSFSVKVLPYE